PSSWAQLYWASISSCGILRGSRSLALALPRSMADGWRGGSRGREARLGRLIASPPLLTRPDAFARRGIGVIHDEIIRAWRRARRGLGFVRRAIAPRPRYELKNFSAHDRPSQIMMRINKVSAS